MNTSLTVKLLVLFAAVLTAIIIGLLGAILYRLDGQQVPACMIRGTATFGVSLTLLILTLNSIGILG